MYINFQYFCIQCYNFKNTFWIFQLFSFNVNYMCSTHVLSKVFSNIIQTTISRESIYYSSIQTTVESSTYTTIYIYCKIGNLLKSFLLMLLSENIINGRHLKLKFTTRFS